MWPEIPPVEPFESGIEELTGVRPYKGTLMYYRQLGIYDPYEAAEAPEPLPGERTSDIIYYLEQSHHKALPARHTLQGQRIRALQSNEAFRPKASQRTRRGKFTRPEESRELIGPPRPGRATELFLQGRARADHHVVDETNVCPVAPRSRYKLGPRFALTRKSPWTAACESSFGDPREAFQEVRPPTKEILHRQPPAVTRVKHHSEPQLGYSEMDYAHAPRRGGGQSHQYHHQQQQQVRSSSTWKGGMSQPGQSFKRFHAGVVPYETDFNRKAIGWQTNYVPEDPTDFIFPQDDFDSGSSNRGSGGGQQQYGDYNPRPRSWQSAGQQEDEEPYVPLTQRRSAFDQQEQAQYYNQQQQYHHSHQQRPQPRQHQAQQHRQQQRHPGTRTAPKSRGRGSAAVRQDYAGPQTWGGNLMESDDL